MNANYIVKTAMDAYAFGMSAGLQELGFDKAAADDMAIKEAATPAALRKVMQTASKGYQAAKGGIGKGYGAAKGGAGKAKDVAKTVAGKIRGAGASAAEKAMGVGRGARDVAKGAIQGGRLQRGPKSNAQLWGQKHRRALGIGAAGAAVGAGVAAGRGGDALGDKINEKIDKKWPYKEEA